MSPAMISENLAGRIQDFVKQGIDLNEGRLEARSDPFWKALKDLGSELWLDTGDIDAAGRMWTPEFSALTTNNTLLNAEVQKGIYDGLIAEAAQLLDEAGSGLDEQTRVIEIAFILNARHGLRLAQRFGGKVSVELHTDLAHDLERTLHYAYRYFSICPEYFIVKVPLTPAGLIATRRLREQGVLINFTLGFSARHNAVAAAFAKPVYVNVFLGRINSYVADHALGDGKLVGEKATLASQRIVSELSRGRTKQIAASMRDGQTVADLAGLDVFTMPVKCVADAKATLDGAWTSKLDEEYEVNFSVDPAAIRAETIYAVSDAVRSLGESLDHDPPATAAELVDRAHELGAGDLFPRLTEAEYQTIAADGKIPAHAKWAERIKSGELAIDTLLNLAGLAAFAADQAKLDARIRSLI